MEQDKHSENILDYWITTIKTEHFALFALDCFSHFFSDIIDISVCYV